jgi:hypothetical protein
MALRQEIAAQAVGDLARVNPIVFLLGWPGAQRKGRDSACPSSAIWLPGVARLGRGLEQISPRKEGVLICIHKACRTDIVGGVFAIQLEGLVQFIKRLLEALACPLQLEVEQNLIRLLLNLIERAPAGLCVSPVRRVIPRVADDIQCFDRPIGPILICWHHLSFPLTMELTEAAPDRFEPGLLLLPCDGP